MEIDRKTHGFTFKQTNHNFRDFSLTEKTFSESVFVGSHLIRQLFVLGKFLNKRENERCVFWFSQLNLETRYSRFNSHRKTLNICHALQFTCRRK